MGKGIDNNTLKMLCNAYDIGAEKIEIWKTMLEELDSSLIRDAVVEFIRSSAKPPRISDIVSKIKTEQKETPTNTHIERFTEEELTNEIIKANSKKMEVIVEKIGNKKSIIYWSSHLFIPANAKKCYLNGKKFYLFDNILK